MLHKFALCCHFKHETLLFLGYEINPQMTNNRQLCVLNMFPAIQIMHINNFAVINKNKN